MAAAISYTKINFLQPSFKSTLNFFRGRKESRPKLKFPGWFIKKERSAFQENLTYDNKQFIKEVIQDKYGSQVIVNGVDNTYKESPLLNESMQKGEWTRGIRRTGLIARKIGMYPMWTKEGKILTTTLLQVLDNHVINYTPPEKMMEPARNILPNKYRSHYGSLLIGAESVDPQKLTKEYCGLFTESGVMPKKILTRYLIHPKAVIQPGTPLYASHFSIGEWVDVRGKTIDRGFHGVMKRWGFKGLPASHGVTKSHRRPGNVGGGGAIARIWPGTKMPGHVGNEQRTQLGLQILRINTKYNVIWVQGYAVPGATNSIVYIRDTLLPNKKFTESPKYFPTFYPEDQETPLPEEMLLDKLHPFSDPTIVFVEQIEKKKKKRK